MTEEAIELLQDGRLHDLSEEGVLLGQLLRTEVLPAARGPLVVVEEADEGRVGRLGEQLLVDIREEPGGGGGRPERGLNMEQNPTPTPAGAARPGEAGLRRCGAGAEWGREPLQNGVPEAALFSRCSAWKVGSLCSPSTTETLPAAHPQSLKLSFFVSGDLLSSLPSILPALRRKGLRRGRKRSQPGVGAGAGHCAGRVKGTHGSGQRSTWSLVSEGEMRFWLLRMMSSFWALLMSAL